VALALYGAGIAVTVWAGVWFRSSAAQRAA
jgi:hypothetical protein